ncbi:hypothetical protein [Mucilaginibacter segetis]|uniref:Uncharacterized protein n=1 Tax=Mucilaginibacter segetis TaxID=2793071 RepID=A0A934PSP8_9SPHI|nr:hypothetical protein [Mucilaginibacter segetis]MBK0379364.1 hypothetical protein [Mucilaginibacter segetis]
MKDISLEEKSRAIKISQALEHFFEENRGTLELRSTDAYEVLVTKNLVERDRFRGFFFREFLKKLNRAGALGFIPQCRLVAGEWHFRSAGKQALRSEKLRPVGGAPAPTVEAEKLHGICLAVEKLPKRDVSRLTYLELAKRKLYHRAYEYWSKTEEALLLQAEQMGLGIQELSRIFGRQPSVLETRLKELH